MKHPVAITLVYHPKDKTSLQAAEAFVTHFDKIGMQRSGVQMRVPIRIRSEPLKAEGTLVPIKAVGSEFDTVVVLYGALLLIFTLLGQAQPLAFLKAVALIVIGSWFAGLAG